MVEFCGWEMPVQYKGVIEEHHAVRERVGLFDVSHMGEIFVTGDKARDYINHITTNNIEKINDGRCQYSVCCYEDGGIVDDVISYQINPKKYLIVVNAVNVEKDYEWFIKNNPFKVFIENKSNQYCQLALQGPLAEKVLGPLVPFELNKLSLFRFLETTLSDKKVILSRTGYTGEDGFEIYGNWNDCPFLWETILKEGEPHGIQPIGLAARDTLRLEACYSLYGHEISKEINPFEAGLNRIVKLDKSEFIGKKALEKIASEGADRKLVALEMIGAGIPRHGYEVHDDNRQVGFVTSGTFSPTLEEPIGLALVENEFSEDGAILWVKVRKNLQKGRVVSMPFYQRRA